MKCHVLSCDVMVRPVPRPVPRRRRGRRSRSPPRAPTGFTHLFPLALYCMPPSVAPAPEPGPSLGFRGSRKRFALLSTGCGSIRSHGWTPAFAGVTNPGRSAAWPGQRAHRAHFETRCVHPVGLRGGDESGRSAAWPGQRAHRAHFETRCVHPVAKGAGTLRRCHEVSCCVMRCHVPPRRALSADLLEAPVVCILHVVPPSRFVLFAPPPACLRRVPFSRVSHGRACAPFAPARFARLIARAGMREQTQGALVPCVQSGFFSRWRRAKRPPDAASS